MKAMKRILLSAALLSAASCSGPVACETVAECGASEDSRGYVCVASACQPCDDEAECADGYGAGATCMEGRCTSAGCTPGEEGCACGEGDSCDAGLVCTAGTCRQETVTGCDGCPCAPGDVCDAGLVCVDEICAPETSCPAGTEGCPCAAGGTCEMGQTCDPVTGRCGPCVLGTQMCGCAAGGTCNSGFACEPSPMCPAGTTECCVPSDCGTGTEGTVGCMCRTSDPACDPGAVCRGGLCVCGDNYTGESCEIACTDEQLMVSTDPVFMPSADQGFWLCGHFAASEDVQITGGTFSLRGEVPITPTDHAVLRGATFTVTSR